MSVLINWIAVIGFGLTAVTFFWLHINKDYNIHSYAVSDFIHTRHSKKFWAVLIFNAIGYLALSVFLFNQNKLASIVLFISAIFSVLIAAIPVNKIGTPRTAQAYFHISVAGIFFTLIFFIMTTVHRTVIIDFPSAQVILLGIFTWISRISLIVFLVISLTVGEKYYGIAQRAFIVSSFIWSFIFSICLLVNN